MCGRSAKRAGTLLALLLLAPSPALARRHNLASGLPFGLGFAAGLEMRPKSAFAAGNQTSASNYASYFLFQPYFDYGNLILQPYIGWHLYPDLGGSGVDARGTFTENSQAGNLSYGGRLLLVYYYSESMESRAYLALGYGVATAKLKNVRIYRSAAGAVTSSFTERVEGSGPELTAGMGYEFLLLQNYSLQIEGGYTQRNIDAFKYSADTTDAGGNTRTKGDDVADPYGNKKGFHVWSPYAQIAFNLNF